MSHSMKGRTASESFQPAVPFQLNLTRPRFHVLVFFVGFANLSRTVVAHYPNPGGIAAAVTYGIAPLLAVIIGRLVEKARNDETSRIASSGLGLVGFVLTIISSGHPSAAPLAVAGVMFAMHIAGCALAREQHRGNDMERPPKGGD